MIDTKQIEDLLAKATPWTASIEAKTFAAGGHWYVVLDEDENGIGEFYGADHDANAANVQLAALSPTIAQALIDSRAREDALREALNMANAALLALGVRGPIMEIAAKALAAHPPSDEPTQ